jgi:single-strand DNA-binding protein
MYINKAIVVGNLTRDPELKSLTYLVQKVCSFSVATIPNLERPIRSKTRSCRLPQRFLFRTPSRNVVGQWMKKGSQIYVEGRMTTRSWDDKDTGKENV